MIRADSWLCVVEPMDMRRGVDGLSTWVVQQLGRSPATGTGFIFANRARTRIKLLVWDGNGVWLCLRRLHRGSFVWPMLDDAVFELSLEQFQWLIHGVDWQRLNPQLPSEFRL
jgi:transposase